MTSQEVIPYYYKVHCGNPSLVLTSCDFYMHRDCKGTCYFANKLKNGIKHQAKTGLERFLQRFPNYLKRNERQQQPEDLGIGAMVEEDFRRLKGLRE